MFKNMKSLQEIANTNKINEDVHVRNEQYDLLIEQLQEAKDNGDPIDEGLFKAIFGGLTGAVAGPSIIKAFCKALGVDEKGMFGNLLSSRLFLTALGGYVGWKN